MLDRLAATLRSLRGRVRRFEHREAVAAHRWLENTENLVHVSVLVFVPLLIALVTYLSNRVDLLPYLLFPPLASGTYSLFAEPERSYASPRRFVGGLTAGALCGWLVLTVATRYWYGAPTGQFGVHPGAAAVGVLLTGVVTWALDVEEPSAFSTALLVHVVGEGQFVYVVSVLLSTSLVAAVFLVWRERFYERRGQLLYETTSADDHVLVPMRGDHPGTTATFGARLAAAHDAGKVLLLELLPEVDATDLEGTGPNGRLDPQGESDADPPAPVAEAVARLREAAGDIRTRVGVPCEVAVAAGDPGPTVVETARETDCDLVVTPYEEDHGAPSPFVRTVFEGPVDAVALRTDGERDRWRRVLVAVSRPGDTAHAMVDFGTRLAGRSGTVSVCTCIDEEASRRNAEDRLARIVETFDGRIETRVARADVVEFLARNASAYDLVVLGSSRDRSSASRVVSPPTVRRLDGLDCDLAVVDRGEPA